MTLERVRKMKENCDEYNVPLAGARQFSPREARITSTVAGMTCPKRIAQIPEEARERWNVVGSETNIYSKG